MRLLTFLIVATLTSPALAQPADQGGGNWF